MADREQRIRALAHGIWEQEGRPEGQAERHWLIAEAAVEAMDRAEVETTMSADGATKNETPLIGKETNPGLDVGRESPQPILH